MKKKVKKQSNLKYLVLIIAVAIIVTGLFSYLQTPTKVTEPRPRLLVNMIRCELDQRENGKFSFFFDIKVREGKTRLPGEIFFKINKIYNLEQYEITREQKLDKAYNENETFLVSFDINDVYKDYMYLPSQNFDFQLFYCELTDLQMNYLKNDNIFDSIDEYCILIYDYERINERYIHVVSQNPGEQCEVIQRST